MKNTLVLGNILLLVLVEKCFNYSVPVPVFDRLLRNRKNCNFGNFLKLGKPNFIVNSGYGEIAILLKKMYSVTACRFFLHHCMRGTAKFSTILEKFCF